MKIEFHFSLMRQLKTLGVILLSFMRNINYLFIMDWFFEWFNSPYYHILYKNRNDKEAHLFIDHLVQKFQPKNTATMLDLACGKGRHSIYLAEKGFDVTGVDLSEKSIAHAQEFETEKLHFFVHDMRRKSKINYYDFIFNFFTSFGYFSKEIDHQLTLDAISKGLKKEGIFVMDFMNAHKIIQHLIPEEKKEVDGITFHISRFVESGTIVKKIQFQDKGKHYDFQERVRAFSLSEMARLFRKSGLQLVNVYGDYELNPYDVFSSNRMILIAKK